MEILLVDDETVIHRAVGTFLSRCGYSIEVANNGAEALHKVVEETPDVVISDIKMPVMDGLQLLERLRVCTPATPVILITGHGHMDSAVAALHEGAFAYLRKPINLDELLATLERIKENKCLESALLEERAKSARAQRLATVGTLAAGVAHEINNPNTLVRANLQTFQHIWRRLENHLQYTGNDKAVTTLLDEIPDLIDTMLNGTERITRIVNQVLMFSRDQSEVSPTQVDLSHCIFEALKIVEPKCDGVALEKHFLERHAYGIAQELTQVFVNLIDNALQAVTGMQDGCISIKVASGEDDWTTVCIQDNGPGVEQAITEKIFDPFFTTKMPGQGTGLGLSICHRIVTEHGGNISCSSHSGQGALFCVRLPPAKAQTIAASA